MGTCVVSDGAGGFDGVKQKLMDFAFRFFQSGSFTQSIGAADNSPASACNHLQVERTFRWLNLGE